MYNMKFLAVVSLLLAVQQCLTASTAGADSGCIEYTEKDLEAIGGKLTGEDKYDFCKGYADQGDCKDSTETKYKYSFNGADYTSINSRKWDMMRDCSKACNFCAAPTK